MVFRVQGLGRRVQFGFNHGTPKFQRSLLLSQALLSCKFKFGV